MDETAPNPPIMPQAATPPVYGPVGQPAAPPPKAPLPWKKFIPVFVIVGIILIILIVSSRFVSYGPTQPAENTSPTPTLTTTPAQPQTLVPFATSSAFLNFEKNITSFPGTIQNAVLLDQTIEPPVLNLSLGFSN